MDYLYRKLHWSSLSLIEGLSSQILSYCSTTKNQTPQNQPRRLGSSRALLPSSLSTSLSNSIKQFPSHHTLLEQILHLESKNVNRITTDAAAATALHPPRHRRQRQRRARRALREAHGDLPPAAPGPAHDAAHPPDVPGHFDDGVPGDDDPGGRGGDAEADGELRVCDAGREFRPLLLLLLFLFVFLCPFCVSRLMFLLSSLRMVPLFACFQVLETFSWFVWFRFLYDVNSILIFPNLWSM